MSRWYLTSHQAADRDARSACYRSYLHPSGQLSGPGLFGEAYFKRVLSTPNVFEADHDWLCAAGTIIYEGQLGEPALRHAFADFIAGGVRQVQANSLGHYAIAVKRDNEVTIFTDPQGALNLYYLHDGDIWFASNALSLTARVLTPRIDPTKLLVSAIQTNLPGEDTFFRGIKRLFGTQQIRIDLKRNIFRVETISQGEPSLRWDLPGIDDVLEQYKSEVQSVFHQLAAVGSIGLFGTGGLDSRTILAGLLDQNAKVQLMYGIGNTRLSDYDYGDLDVIKQIASRYDLPFQQLDWSGTQPYEERKLQELFRRYGFKYEIYGAPESFIRAFNGEIFSYPQLFMGGYSPAFTNSKPWEWPRKTYTFRDLIATTMQYHNGPLEQSECIADIASYKAIFAEQVRIALDCAGISFPEAGASLETMVRAKLFLYIRAESRFLNFANTFGHYVAPFLMKRLYEPLVTMPLEFRAHDEFQIRLIHALFPDLVNIPLYSGWSPARVDLKTFRLVRDQAPHQQPRALTLRVASRLMPPAVRAQARKLLSRILRAKQEKSEKASREISIVDTYGRAVMNDRLGRQWFRSVRDFSPKELTRIRHYLAAINEMGYSE